MKAIEFVKKYSLKKAREVIAGCPRCYHYYHVVQGDYYTCPQRLRVAIKDLKRVVKSVDLINSLKEIGKSVEKDKPFHDWCSKWLDQANVDCKRLNRAIRDYESIYQPKCIHGFDVACLICGFGTIDGERIYRTQGANHEIK
ncbi:hypothetical protein [Acinetobacter sp. V115_6]|uniref:hypothetical protein n=1 Tax=Acinetobacter sp. V115_6 TaxID=3072987 RepID=UPI00287C8915|nr:hypothetical protein [Acinetobacter sp. V115_6]MDS7927545.1 hypothetical protein [Acinetobacter sp. V115_6]